MTDLPVRRFTARDGLELAYRETGDGRPLVLFHGFTADGSQWLDHGPATAIAERGHRVVLPDLRGHGASTGSPSYPPDVLADDGLALIEALGLEDYDLGGYSLGARVVVRMLVRGARPARAIVAGQGLAAITATTGRGDAYRGVLTALADGDPLEPGSPEAEAAHWITLSGNDPVALREVLDTDIATPETALHRIGTPTLVVIGDRDRAHSSAEALAGALPNARFTRVPGDHFTALTAPEFAAAVVDFL